MRMSARSGRRSLHSMLMVAVRYCLQILASPLCWSWPLCWWASSGVFADALRGRRSHCGQRGLAEGQLPPVLGFSRVDQSSCSRFVGGQPASLRLGSAGYSSSSEEDDIQAFAFFDFTPMFPASCVSLPSSELLPLPSERANSESDSSRANDRPRRLRCCDPDSATLLPPCSCSEPSSPSVVSAFSRAESTASSDSSLLVSEAAGGGAKDLGAAALLVVRLPAPA